MAITNPQNIKGNILAIGSVVTVFALILGMCLSKSAEEAIIWFVVSIFVHPIALVTMQNQVKKEEEMQEAAAQQMAP